MYTKTEKKQFIIFLLLAYGLTYVMGLLMWYGNASGMDVSAFPNAQMMYPAAGVALAYLITGKKEQKLPKGFYAVFFILTVIMAAIAVVSTFVKLPTMGTAEASISAWTLLIQGMLIIGSILCWIALTWVRKSGNWRPAQEENPESRAVTPQSRRNRQRGRMRQNDSTASPDSAAVLAMTRDVYEKYMLSEKNKVCMI